jgi:hypothetical protein
MAASNDRHVSGMIEQSLLLLERGIVLLVNDDKSQLFHRSEYG